MSTSEIQTQPIDEFFPTLEPAEAFVDIDIFLLGQLTLHQNKVLCIPSNKHDAVLLLAMDNILYHNDSILLNDRLWTKESMNYTHWSMRKGSKCPDAATLKKYKYIYILFFFLCWSFLVSCLPVKGN